VVAGVYRADRDSSTLDLRLPDGLSLELYDW
jgi:hypothetical protein